jgi:hypothetical protein
MKTELDARAWAKACSAFSKTCDRAVSTPKQKISIATNRITEKLFDNI